VLLNDTDDEMPELGGADGQRAAGKRREAARFVKNQWYHVQMVSRCPRQFILSPDRLRVLNITGKDTISLAQGGQDRPTHPLYRTNGWAATYTQLVVSSWLGD
jgi:hypothetical protein